MKTYTDPEEALKAFDKEHGADTDGGEQCDTPNCPDCGEPMLPDELVDATLEVHVEQTDDGRYGTLVKLPDSKMTAYLFLLSIMQTMSLAGDESIEDIIKEVMKLQSKGALQEAKNI